MTLDEYKAQQASSRASQPQFNLRKANEGADHTQWKKTYALERKKNEDEEEDDEEEDDDDEVGGAPWRVSHRLHFRNTDAAARTG